MARCDEKDGLDKAIEFLKKRDGIDKALKLLQYSSKLAVSLEFAAKDTRPEGTVGRLSTLAGSVSQSRKALRLGKFLSDFNKLRKQPSLSSPLGALEALCNGANCVYYFVEQFVWLSKAGIITDKRWQRRLSRASVRAEMLGYVASVALKSLQLSAIREQELALQGLWTQRKAASPSVSPVQATDEEALVERVAALRVRRMACLTELLQDLLDSLIAWDDIRGGGGGLAGHPTTLAAAGLASAWISARKNWP